MNEGQEVRKQKHDTQTHDPGSFLLAIVDNFMAMETTEHLHSIH